MNMPNRPVHVTSTTHAMALWAYGVLAGVGLCFVFGLSSRGVMLDLLQRQVYVTIWGLMWWASGVVGFWAAIIAGFVKAPYAASKIRLCLLFEAAGAAGLTVSLGIYLAGILTSPTVNAGSAVTLLVYAGGYVGGTTHRFVQIYLERRRLALAASRPPRTAEVLAEPSHGEQ